MFFALTRWHRGGVVKAALAGFLLLAMPDALVGTGPALAGCGDSAGKGVDWQNCRKRSLIVSGTDFTGANLSRADLSSSDLRDTILVDANLEKANIVRASLAGSDGQGANLSGIIASRTDFSNVNLAGANLEKAEIVRADFSGTVLEGVDMTKAEFFRVNFDGAKIGDVDFSFSNLARSDLRKAEITGPISMKSTFLFLTRLEGVDLTGVTGLQAWQLDIACGDDSTKLPDHLLRPGSWPCDDGADE